MHAFGRRKQNKILKNIGMNGDADNFDPILNPLKIKWRKNEDVCPRFSFFLLGLTELPKTTQI